MATSTQQPLTERKHNWTELKEPEMLKFEREGSEYSGYLIDMQKVDVKGKPTREYTLKLDETGEIATFLGTYSIDKKFASHWPKAKGCRIAVKYLGENTQVKTQGNPMKMFMVLCDFTDRIGGKSNDPNLEISEEDLPDFLK